MPDFKVIPYVRRLSLLVSALLLYPLSVSAEEIGSVSTVFKMLGPNHKIVIEAFDDPDISGVSCWLARPKTGGIKGGLGLAEDPSDGSIACRQVGPIVLPDDLEEGEQVFNKRTSLVFKTLQVVRFYDEKRHTLIYLVYSDKVIEGSPKNSISVVPIRQY